MQCLSSFSHAWTHVVQYRAQSLLPCPFYHKSQSSEASNHKSTDEAAIISLFADSTSPLSSSGNHLTALSWTDEAIVYSQYYQFFGSTDFLDANKAVVSACRRHLRMTLLWSPSIVFSVERTSPNHHPKNIFDVTTMGKEVKYSYYLHFFVHKASISKLQFAKGH